MKQNISIGAALGAIVIALASLYFGVNASHSDGTPVPGSSANSTNYDQLGALELKVGTGCNSSFGYTNCSAAIITSAGTFTQGGGIFATSSIGAVTLDVSSIASANVIERSGASASTMTLPASTTLTSFVPTAGQTRSIYIFNNGAGTLTIAGGTGTLLEAASTTAMLAGSFGRLDFVRKANTDVEVLFNQGI